MRVEPASCETSLAQAVKKEDRRRSWRNGHLKRVLEGVEQVRYCPHPPHLEFESNRREWYLNINIRTGVWGYGAFL